MTTWETLAMKHRIEHLVESADYGDHVIIRMGLVFRKVRSAEGFPLWLDVGDPGPYPFHGTPEYIMGLLEAAEVGGKPWSLS